ncbi:MAG: hypothetical protein HYX61_08565 [Gammaproteobacteria bacterium]|jgi:hypothetical protein|nr:hypothetical protein [Gammaproteobacteria bacterium]
MRFPLNIHQFQFNSSSLKFIPIQTFSIILVFFIIFGVCFFYKWYRCFIKARAIEDIPTAKIRSAAQGYVELKGIQKNFHRSPTVAPLSKIPSTWYRYKIEYLQKDSFIPIEQGESSQSFILADDTGKCIVEPDGALITTPIYDVWRGFSKYPNGKPKNILWRIICSLGRFRYQEWRMEQGMNLYAAGNFMTKPNPKDPHLTPINILSNHGLDKRRPYILSAKSEKKIIQHLKLEAFFWLLGYISMLIIVCWLLVMRFSN